MKYNPKIVIAYFKSEGIPTPELEFKFHPVRKWRFDFAWPENHCVDLPIMGVYLEVQGGIWVAGGHNRGAQMKKDWEKYNAATELGWRPLFVEPCDLTMKSTADTIKRALWL